MLFVWLESLLILTFCASQVCSVKRNKRSGGFSDKESMVKNLPANAGHKFDPWSRKNPHAVEQLRLCVTSTVLWSLRAATTKAHIP